MHRNTRFLVGSGLVLFSSVLMAQNAPTKVQPSPPIQAVAIPNAVSYPFPYPANHTLQPTVDAAGTTYLPAIGQNLVALVQYQQLFWQMQQDGVNGATSAYKSSSTMTANTQLIPIVITTLKNTTAITLADVQNAMEWGLDASMVKGTYATIPGTDITPSSKGDSLLNDFAFNADNLLSVTGYESKSKDDVKGLVAFLSGSANPIGGLTLSPDKDKRTTQLGLDSVKSYLVEARAATAAQSVALSNLNYLAQERLVVPGLGKDAGMTTFPTDGTEQTVADASQLQLEQFLVDRRVGNTSWYTNMNTASSVAIQRETLFVLAEISKQLYQQKILMERLLAEQIAMQQATAQINSTKIAYDQQSVQQTLSSGS